MKRRARKQVAKSQGPQFGSASRSASSGEYNIWYHKKVGKREERRPATSRCCVATDAGATVGSDKGAWTFCLHFARGCCRKGGDCTYLHRIPTAADEDKLETTIDIFGRERHATDRDDMGGVGSFSREMKTLYIGGISGSRTELQRSVRTRFGEWGPLHHVKLFADRGFAFVRYRFRSSAEFAKEAMDRQPLEPLDLPSKAKRRRNAQIQTRGGMLNIKWATNDPNPGVVKRNLQLNAQALVAAKVRAGELPPDCLSPANKRRPHPQQQWNAQHGGAQHGGAQHGGAQYGGAQHGGAYYGGAQHGGAQHGGAQHGGAYYGGAQHGGAQPPQHGYPNNQMQQQPPRQEPWTYAHIPQPNAITAGAATGYYPDTSANYSQPAATPTPPPAPAPAPVLSPVVSLQDIVKHTAKPLPPPPPPPRPKPQAAALSLLGGYGSGSGSGSDSDSAD